MNHLVRPLIVFGLLLGIPGFAAGKEAARTFDWYLKQYPFMTYRGQLNTFETEFKLPDGFKRIDSDKLTQFQFWVSNMPLWDAGKSVFSITSGSVLNRDRISRPVHFPWRTSHLTDCVIPLQLLVDFMVWKKRPFDLAFVTKLDDTLRYKDFLKSKVSYTPHLRVNLLPAEKRDPSPEEFNGYFDLCAFNTDYSGLTKNCVKIADSALRPGDLYIGRDTLGTTGKVYVILVMVTDGKGDYRYIVGAGCDQPCDFHIPLFHGNRANPWLTADELKGLLTTQPIVGFYRLKMPGKK